MDEPLSNLDAKLRGHMRAELKHMQHALGITTIYVTHDQVEAMTLAHRVALLEEGKLQQLDTPRTIYDDPANLFVAGFVGSPPMNMMHGALEDGSFVKQSVKIATGVKGSHPSVVLGVRPEDGAIVAPGQGAIAGEVFATELIGDHTLVTATSGRIRSPSRRRRTFRPMSANPSPSISQRAGYTCSTPTAALGCVSLEARSSPRRVPSPQCVVRGGRSGISPSSSSPLLSPKGPEALRPAGCFSNTDGLLISNRAMAQIYDPLTMPKLALTNQ